MDFVNNQQEVVENILTIEGYLIGADSTELNFAKERVRLGKTICVYKINGENHFAPSRFLGYKNNSMDAHLDNKYKNGMETNPVIDKIVGRHFTNLTTDDKFKAYLQKLEIEIPNNKRKYWRLKNKQGKNLNIEL